MVEEMNVDHFMVINYRVAFPRRGATLKLFRWLKLL